MTYEAVVEAGQTIYDIAIQEYGSVLYTRWLIQDNQDLSYATVLQPGDKLTIRANPDPDQVDATQMNYFRAGQRRVLNDGTPPTVLPINLRDHDDDHNNDHN